MREEQYIDIQCVGIRVYLDVSSGIENRVEDPRNGLMPSIFPRITAAIFVLLLIGSIALVSIGAVALLGPAFAHGTNVSHADGKIVAIGPGRNFILETAAGQHLSFRCEAQCRGSLGHLQRHMNEKAHTDVYYIQGPNKSLMVLDVD